MDFAALQVDTGWLWAAAATAAVGVPLVLLCWATDRSRDRRWHEERHHARPGYRWDTAIEEAATAARGSHDYSCELSHAARNGKPAGVFDYEAEAD